MNNLSGAAAALKLYAYGADGRLTPVADDLWALTDGAGQAVTELTDGTLYEVRVTVADGGAFDLSSGKRREALRRAPESNIKKAPGMRQFPRRFEYFGLRKISAASR